MSGPECAECPLSDAFDGITGDPCCEKDPTTPRCESCGVPLVKHMGLTGTCAEKQRYLKLLRRVLKDFNRTPNLWRSMGYPDVADFMREEYKG